MIFVLKEPSKFCYGTNAVGKTSLIRALELVIMAQCGMYVPCGEFIQTTYRYFFAYSG